MSEVIRTSLELYPALGATAGLMIGAVPEYLAQRREETNRAAANETLSDINQKHLDESVTKPDLIKEESQQNSLRDVMLRSAKGNADNVPSDTQTPAEPLQPQRKFSRAPIFGRIVLRSIPFMCAAAGYVATDVLHNSASETVSNQNGQIIVDRAGGTEYGKGKTSPAETINKVLIQFKEQKDSKFSVQVAKSGTHPEQPLRKALAEKPFGEAPLRQAYDDAIRAIDNVGDKSTTDKKTPVLVITDNQTFGSANKVVSKANGVNSSVYIVNVSDSPGKSEDAFKRIAKKTEGKYWNISGDGKIEDVSKAITDEATATKPESGLDINLLPPAALFAAGLLLGIREMRQKPLNLSGPRKLTTK